MKQAPILLLALSLCLAQAEVQVASQTAPVKSVLPGATIATNTGVFAWHIPIASGGTIETVIVRVADNGTPSMSDKQSFVVFIGAATMPQISTATLSNGVFNLLIAGDVGPDYTVQTSTNLTAWNGLADHESHDDAAALVG